MKAVRLATPRDPQVELVRFNTYKAIFVLTALSGLLLLVGRLVGGHVGQGLTLVLALVIDVGACCYAERLALWMADARPAPEAEHARLHRLVSESAARLGLPGPGVYLIDEPAPNAFAVGRDPRHAAVAATTGLVTLLDDRELAAVLTHELAHVGRRDSVVAGAVAVIVFGLTLPLQAILALARPALDLVRGYHGGRGPDATGSARRALMLYLAPLIAPILHLAIPRRCEYAADASGALAGDPQALASALEKLERQILTGPPIDADPAIYHLFIVDPYPDWSLAPLFSPRPSTHDRIQRLQQLTRPAG